MNARQVSNLFFALAGAGVLYMFTAIALAHYVIAHHVQDPAVRSALIPMIKAAPFLVPSVIVFGVLGLIVRMIYRGE